MKLQNIYGNETKLRNAFSWLTRIGAGRKFGSLPVGWYQIHQCACLDKLKVELQSISAELPTPFDSAELRCKTGNIQVRTLNGWKTLISSISLFQSADNAVRNR